MSENNVRQSLDAFRETMSKRIKDRIARPTIAQSVQDQSERQAERKSTLAAEFKADRATYIIMGISAIFTAVLGLILGLAPNLQTAPDGTTSIYFHTDLIHWGIALVYAVAFVTVTEAAFLIAKNKFHAREEGNNVQWISMAIMLFLAGVSIIGTGWAGGTVGASVLGFLTEFKEVPASAQKWVVGIIPVLLALYAFCLTVYRLSSEEAKSKRITEGMGRLQRLDHQFTMSMAELEAEEMMLLAETKAFLAAVERGALTAGEALAAKKAGKTLGQLEIEKGKDLDGNGQVGTVSNDSQIRQDARGADFRPAPRSYPQNESEDVPALHEYLHMSKSQLVIWMEDNQLYGETETRTALRNNNKIGSDLSNNRFKKMFYKTFPERRPNFTEAARENGVRP